ncbi:MAG: hypothetical protein E6K54_07960 [Gammaproteobacteria bacterium]|nr:MAG: hypothetical protein E6K54_07960 [Gammaproteobacteria bacterium]
MFHVVVEGNIGAGKTSLILALAELFKEENIFVTTQLEQIEKWRNYNGVNMLKSVYDNKDVFQFQILALVDALKYEICPDSDRSNGVLLIERSSFSVVEIFSTLLCTELENKILKDLRNKLLPALKKPDVILYVRTDSRVCKKRVWNRGRKEEITIKKKYLDNLHVAHDTALAGNSDLLVVDGSKPINDLAQDIFQVLKKRLDNKVIA